jgi:dipeptidyl-peptidase 4
MRQQLEFGATDTHRGTLDSSISSPSFTSFPTVFLIDTPAIRNVANSLPMNTSCISNRHSPRPSVARIFAIALLIGFGSTITLAQPQQPSAKQLTVERIYSAPSLSGYQIDGIEWSPDGKRITYFEGDGRGSRQLAEMDAATGKHSILVNANTLEAAFPSAKTSAIQSTGLGRIEAATYLWSPDGNSLLLVGGSNLVLLDLKTMSSKPLIKGDADVADPKFSPDGKWVSFVRDSNLWVVNLGSGEVRALTTGGSEEILKGQLDWVYPEELDATTAYWWAPDSSKIAYYEMDERPVTRYPIMDMSSPVGAMDYTRFPQAGEANPVVRVGVVSVTGGDTKWMDTGANTDVYLPRVDWLRDSQRVAIQRLNRAQNRLDLEFCDASTGASQTILTETDKYWVNVSADLYFFSDNKRFLWSSERTGFRHYYLYDLSGKQLQQLTSGDWDISGNGGFGPGAASHPAVDEAHGSIYFLSNKDDVRDTQLYRLSLNDKSVTRVSREPGTHDVIIAPDESAFVDAVSTTMKPPSQDLDRIDGSRIAAINENGVPELADYHLSPVEFLDLTADDGTKLYADIIKPPNFDPSRKYPVLFNVYGGPQVQNVRNEWGRVDFLWLEMMAEKGFVVFTLDSRGSYGRGHAFESAIYHQFGKVELEDQLTGVNYLKSLPYVDGSRIGIWGWSYGAYMTLYAMSNAPDVFKAGVAVAPVSDWKLYDTIYTERYMGRPQENAAGYANSSPVNQASNLKGKLMLAHGTGDDNVHFANTSEMINALIAAGRYPTDVMIFPGRGHPISDRPARIQLFERITNFFLNNL